MITVISGGQTGVDQAALRAARACGLATGGIDLKEVDDHAWATFARDQTPEQAVAWLKERLK